MRYRLVYLEQVGVALTRIHEEVTERQMEYPDRRFGGVWYDKYGMETVDYTGN